jgi:hypothetical protein
MNGNLDTRYIQRNMHFTLEYRFFFKELYPEKKLDSEHYIRTLRMSPSLMLPLVLSYVRGTSGSKSNVGSG